jgi:hypothetical protein
MANESRHLRLKRGDTGVFNIPVTNAVGEPYTLPASDLKIWFTAKSDLSLLDGAAEISVGSTNTGRTGATVIDAAGGIIQVQIPAAVTADIDAYVLQYDCQIEHATIPRMTIDEGFLYLTNQVTLDA